MGCMSGISKGVLTETFTKISSRIPLGTASRIYTKIHKKKSTRIPPGTCSAIPPGSLLGIPPGIPSHEGPLGGVLERTFREIPERGHP